MVVNRRNWIKNLEGTLWLFEFQQDRLPKPINRLYQVRHAYLEEIGSPFNDKGNASIRNKHRIRGFLDRNGATELYTPRFMQLSFLGLSRGYHHPAHFLQPEEWARWSGIAEESRSDEALRTSNIQSSEFGDLKFNVYDTLLHRVAQVVEPRSAR